MACLLRKLHIKHHLQDRWSRLYRIAYSWCHDPQLSKDLTQETVMKAWKNSHQLQDLQAIDSWLISILVNCWRDVCRRQKDTVDVEEETLHHLDTPEAESERLRIILRVRKAVGELSLEHREIVTLVDLEQLSYKEVSEVLQLPIGTVMSRLCRARRQLKAALHDLDMDAPQRRIRRIK